MVIIVELCREYHSSTSATAIRRELKPFDVRTDPPNQIKLVVKPKKKIILHYYTMGCTQPH
jgi:hypothetical protein